MLKNHLLNEIRNNYTALEKNYELAQETIEYENEILSKLEEKEMTEQLYRAIDSLPEQKESSLPVQAERQFIQSGNRRKNADIHTDCPKLITRRLSSCSVNISISY